MAAFVGPQMPEEDAALRELAARHRRRHRWVALLASVVVSGHTTIILHTIWHNCPLDARDLLWLAFFVVNALGGLGWLAWGLRGLREGGGHRSPLQSSPRHPLPQWGMQPTVSWSPTGAPSRDD